MDTALRDENKSDEKRLLAVLVLLVAAQLFIISRSFGKIAQVTSGP
jgi:hypothetical protein